MTQRNERLRPTKTTTFGHYRIEPEHHPDDPYETTIELRTSPTCIHELLADLDVTRSYSRPRVSNDNPYSEAQFKTLKYCPAFPDRFDSLHHAREFAAEFFTYYNHEHRHSGIGLHTPASVHYGAADDIHDQRQATLDTAWQAHPDDSSADRDHRPYRPPHGSTNQQLNPQNLQNT